jgi:O-antigen biosynthesis protein
MPAEPKNSPKYPLKSPKDMLKVLYLTIAPKGSVLYASTHTIIRGWLNRRYKKWIKQTEALSAGDLNLIQQQVKALPLRPLISVIMPVFNTNLSFLDQAIQSVRDQTYPHWQLCIADDASTQPGVKETILRHSGVDARIKCVFRTTNGHISAASNSALELATGEYIALLDHDDLLHPQALFNIASEINAYPDCAVIYSDEDKITPTGKRIDPYFKSDFDYDLFLSQNMVSHLGVYKREIIQKIGGFRKGLEGSQDYDLLLRVLPEIEVAQVRHIPKVLYHWRISGQSVADSIDIKPYALSAGKQALEDYFDSQNINASVAPYQNFGYKTCYKLPEKPPTVELILSSQKAPDQILRISRTVLKQSHYPSSNISLRLSLDESGLYYIKTSLEKEYPNINLSLNPLSSDHASNLNQWITDSKADIVSLIDDSCIGFSPGWLGHLVSFAIQPGVGCLSPKLMYKNGYIHNCGMILGADNLTNYLFNGASAANLNYYFGWSSLHKGSSALPANCLVFQRSQFIALGGFSKYLTSWPAQAIDLCLKMRSTGLRNIVVPEVVVTLDRSKKLFGARSAETVISNETEKHYLLESWREWFENDPAFNPNLTLHKGKPVVRVAPRRNTKPA